MRLLVDERGIRGFGTETIATDAGQGFYYTPPYPAHFYLHGAGRFGLQCLKQPRSSAGDRRHLIAAPLKIKNGTGSPLRVIALSPRAGTRHEDKRHEPSAGVVMAERSFKKEVEDLRLSAGEIFRGEGILAITKALLQSGVAYVGGYQGSPISHLMDVLADSKDVLNELGVHFEIVGLGSRRRRHARPPPSCIPSAAR